MVPKSATVESITANDRTASQMPVEFLPDTGYGSEKCHGRVDHRQPTHILERAKLTCKRWLHQYSNPPEFADTRSVLDSSFEDACLVEMPAHQKTVLSQLACITGSRYEEHLINDQ